MDVTKQQAAVRAVLGVVVESLKVAEDLTARIPEPALLFALKLHSGRLADARDLVIIGAEADLDPESISNESNR